ncbi:MAG TPA: hypothetical protein VGR62_01415 [Candidatus Binatia bacterium]|jgi:hypothetical protein|nr:hypothetical protein [Candidatus Binatia bacterium]
MLVLLLLLLLTAPATAGTCDTWATPPQQVGTVPEELRELSGLAASRRHPGILWAHNDSGNTFTLYALHEDGSIVARFPVRGGTARDAEDITVARCAPDEARTCIYLADIGDNGQRRKQVTIFKIPEPATLTDGPLEATPLHFIYDEGPRNAEVILVDPRTGRIFIVSKVLSSLGDVFRVDNLGARTGGTAVRVRRLRPAKEFDSYTTSASVHPDGKRILLRTYGRAWELRAPDARSFEDVLDATPIEVPSSSQPQAEAITYSADGMSYFLGSEGVGSPIYRVNCK